MLQSDSTDSVLRFAEEDFAHLQPDIQSLEAKIAAEIQAENDLQRRLGDLNKTLDAQLAHADKTPVETINQLRQVVNELVKSEDLPNRQFVQHKEDPSVNAPLLLQKLNDLEARVELNEKFAQIKTAVEARIKDAYGILDKVRNEGVKPANNAEASHKLLTVSFFKIRICQTTCAFKSLTCLF